MDWISVEPSLAPGHKKLLFTDPRINLNLIWKDAAYESEEFWCQVSVAVAEMPPLMSTASNDPKLNSQVWYYYSTHIMDADPDT